jgi:hypothetical protein
MWIGRRAAFIGTQPRLHARRGTALTRSQARRVAAFICLRASRQNRNISASRPFGMLSEVDLSRDWMHAAPLSCLAPLGEWAR